MTDKPSGNLNPELGKMYEEMHLEIAKIFRSYGYDGYQIVTFREMGRGVGLEIIAKGGVFDKGSPFAAATGEESAKDVSKSMNFYGYYYIMLTNLKMIRASSERMGAPKDFLDKFDEFVAELIDLIGVDS